MANAVIFEKREITNFESVPNFGGLHAVEFLFEDGPPNSIPPFSLEADAKYVVEWDNTEYTVIAIDGSTIEEGAVVLGNGSLFGLPSTEPFAIIQFPLGMLIICMDSTCTSTTHSVAIYQEESGTGEDTSTGIIVKDRDGNDVIHVGATRIRTRSADGSTKVFCDVDSIKLQDKTVTGNGEYTADEGFDGLGTVIVAAPESIGIDKLLDGSIVEIHSPVESVRIDTFKECSNLEVIDLPNATKFVESTYFMKPSLLYKCPKIRRFYAPKVVYSGNLAEMKNNTTLEEFIFPGFTNTIPTSFAYNCSNLETVNFDNAPSVGNSAFQDCTKLKNVSVNNIDRISSLCFSGCTSLTRLDLPKVATIDGQGLSCANLETLILRNEAVVSLGSGYPLGAVASLSAIVRGTCYIYVPAALLSAYKTSTATSGSQKWSTFAAQFRAIEDYPDVCG